MKAEDRKMLECWCRSVHFTDQDEDGIGELTASFKIRDAEDEMHRIYDAMSKDDAKEIARGLVDSVAMACEDYDEDWDDPDSGFSCEFYWDDERDEIVVSCNFRT